VQGGEFKIYPYCKERIRETAIKCRFCGEWIQAPPAVIEGPTSAEQTEMESEGEPALLQQPPIPPGPAAPSRGSTTRDPLDEFDTTVAPQSPAPTAASQQPVHSVEGMAVPTTITLEETSSGKLIAFVTLLPAGIIVFDAIVGILLNKLFQELGQTAGRLIIYSLYFSLGVWGANWMYRRKRLTQIIASSFAVLFAYRFLTVALSSPNFIGHAMLNTLEEAPVIYIPFSIFSVLFRRIEPKLDFAKVESKSESVDPDTKSKYDSGTCSRCGAITVTGKERLLSWLIGKSTVYFCGNCKRFIQGNPFNNIFLGITGSLCSFVSLIALASSTSGQSSSATSMGMLVLLVGIYEGIKAAIVEIKGVARSVRKRGALGEHALPTSR
jgi:hypothetical protein